MKVTYTPEDLIAFEEEVAELFTAKRILAPIHLAGGNEQQLIDLFRERVNPEDWVLCQWRSHYHAILKGVPRAEVMQAILDGKSIALCFPEYRILSSAIVGGVAPIAVGIALALKLKEAKGKVVCFLGDMSAESGIVHESVKYASSRSLPLLFVVEDNGVSVQTSTPLAWAGYPTLKGPNVVRYRYNLTRPHVGVGKHVSF